MAKYAEKTTVPAARSRDEIEHTLQRFGASSFAYATQPRLAQIMFEIKGLRVQFRMQLPDRQAAKYTQTANYRARSTTAQADLYDADVRQLWRALALVIKAKLAAVEAGITTVEDEFLSHIVLPQGGTVGEYVMPMVTDAYAGKPMPALMPGSAD